jgi:hypothetical protein
MKKTIGIILAVILMAGFSQFLLSDGEVKLDIIKKPTYKTIPECWVVYQEFEAPRGKMDPPSIEFNNELKRQKVKPQWLYLEFFNWSEDENVIIKWIRGTVVSEKIDVKPPLKIMKKGNVKAWVYTHTGTLENLGDSNKLLEDYIKDNGMKHKWPIIEFIRANPLEVHIWCFVEKYIEPKAK